MAAFIAQGAEKRGSMFMKDGIYEKLTVVDTIHAGKPARFFIQDHSISGGMALESETLLFDYTKYYALYQLVQPKLAHALFIGGGVYSMPKALYYESPETRIDVVDIEPGLETIAKKYFRLPETPMITTFTADGRRFLFDSTTLYDLIFSDVYYSLYSIPSHITTKEFFETARAKLAPNGIFLANIIGSTEHTPVSLLFSEIRTMREVFPNMEVIAVDSTTSPVLQNFILVGINGTSTLRDGLLNYEGDDVTLKHLSEHLLPLSDLPLGAHEILTDNFAPVEHLVADLIKTSALTAKYGNPLTAALPNTFFSGENALHDIERIVKIGSRAIGTPGHDELARALEKELRGLTAHVVIQSWEHGTKDGRIIPLTNIVARFEPENPHRILVGTHYDSIARAYRDKKNPDGFMPGANNSASGVATLLELARVLKDTTSSSSAVGVDLVFFDGEEGELALGAGDQNWSPLGSTYFASKLATLYPDTLPHTGIILDMVCDRDLSLSPEKISIDFASTRVKSFWEIGATIAPKVFATNITNSIGDDHVALNTAGIPSFLVIDFQYEPWFNTTLDTPDKCSAESLAAVGRTVETYIKTR
jgi:spermidine synthase